MKKTWINVIDTVVSGWAEGPAAPTDKWIVLDWRPEKALAAYEYVDVIETQTVPDPDDPENSTIETEVITGKTVQVRADWVDPETP